MLAAYLHRIDPFAVQFTETLGLRWYGLSYLAGFVVAYLMVRHLARSGRSPLKPADVADFVFAVAIGTVIGGRLGYCIFYSPALLIRFDTSFPFWGVLRLNDGGMASHGGVIGIVVACLLFARSRKVSSLHLLDLCSATGPLGVLFGRLANFINGELVGREVSANFPLAVKFPHDLEYLPPEELAKLKPAIDRVGPELLGFNGQQFVDMAHARIEGLTDAINRVVTLTRDNTPVGDTLAEAIEPLLVPRHPSQLYQAAGEGLVVFVILMLVWLRPRKPGVVGAWFLMSYAVLRIVGEQFRQPDGHISHLEYAQFGVTRGQLLSFAMLSVGAVLLWYWARRPADRVGGWLRPKQGG